MPRYLVETHVNMRVTSVVEVDSGLGEQAASRALKVASDDPRVTVKEVKGNRNTVTLKRLADGEG